MSSSTVLAIIGTYRKNGVIDRITDAVLASAQNAGAKTEKIYLIDKDIKYCTNCRACTQKEGTPRSKCVIRDDMDEIMDKIDKADALVIASPMNCSTVTAVMKTFTERIVCYTYWPWGAKAPKYRITNPDKKAVLIASSAMPAIIARIFTKMVNLLKETAIVLGAKEAKLIFAGLSAIDNKQEIKDKVLQKADKMGKYLAQPL
ncbi:MAG: NAD(P)H dehydrogenase [Denitrovibrio sp.]|nr:MAG: NAD(P)H dehydrogenase [Denitrovibrio sp.]